MMIEGKAMGEMGEMGLGREKWQHWAKLIV